MTTKFTFTTEVACDVYAETEEEARRKAMKMLALNFGQEPSGPRLIFWGLIGAFIGKAILDTLTAVLAHI